MSQLSLQRGISVLYPGNSAFVFDFSDWWDQAASGFVLVDLIGHVGAHRLDLNVPRVGIFRFICKPFLFCRGGKGRDEEMKGEENSEERGDGRKDQINQQNPDRCANSI